MAAFQFCPATSERWPDLEKLFGKNGANAGCWCMFWRLERALFKGAKGEGNRQILKQIVEAYPIDMQSPRLAGQTFNSYSGYMGVASAFRALGFEQVGTASETQWIMRLNFRDARSREK